jgi:hypothetical protein
MKKKENLNMDQMPSNEPVMGETKPGPAGWFQVWMKAVTKPSENTFYELTEDPAATSKTAYLWAFIAGTFAMIMQSILQAIYTATGTTPTIPGLEEYMPSTGGDAGSAFVALAISLCLSPVVGGLSVLFFALGTAIMQWIAKLFGGLGTYDKLLYALAAITVPFTLISSVLSLFSAIPFVGACFGIVSLGLSLYVLALQVMAVKGVNRFGWGQAIGSVFIPIFVFFIIVCCCAAGFAFLLAPVMGESFQFAP